MAETSTINDSWIRVDGRYTHRQGRDHYEMVGTDRHEARVFALPRRYEGGRPSFTERFAFEIVEAGSRRGAGTGHIEVVAANAVPLRTIGEAKAAVAKALHAAT